MNINRPGIAMFAGPIFAVALASCSAGGPGALTPDSGRPAAHGVRPLTTVSTRVLIDNASALTVSPSVSLGCWTISPSLPTLGSGSQSSIETLTYDLSCGGSDKLDIVYGTPNCTFETTYSSGFSYSATNSAQTACTAIHSNNLTYDELFTYNTSANPLRGHRHR